MIEKYYLNSFCWRIHFDFAEAATPAILVFVNVGSDDFTDAAEELPQFTVVAIIVFGNQNTV
jgi:hypothetical protein